MHCFLVLSSSTKFDKVLSFTQAKHIRHIEIVWQKIGYRIHKCTGNSHYNFCIGKLCDFLAIKNQRVPDKVHTCRLLDHNRKY